MEKILTSRWHGTPNHRLLKLHNGLKTPWILWLSILQSLGAWFPNFLSSENLIWNLWTTEFRTGLILECNSWRHLCMVHWHQNQSTPCEALLSSRVNFSSQSSQGHSHPYCLCTVFPSSHLSVTIVQFRYSADRLPFQQWPSVSYSKLKFCEWDLRIFFWRQVVF